MNSCINSKHSEEKHPTGHDNTIYKNTYHEVSYINSNFLSGQTTSCDMLSENKEILLNFDIEKSLCDLDNNEEYKKWKIFNDTCKHVTSSPELLSIFHTTTRLNSSWIKCLSDFASIAKINMLILSNLTSRCISVDFNEMSEHQISLIVNNYTGQGYDVRLDNEHEKIIISW